MAIKPFKNKIIPKDVSSLINFGLSENDGDIRYASMAKLQTEGVAALYNFLCNKDFAYLADEVGMGKTYQALGLASVLWNLKPEARIVFISPRKNLQDKWIRDYNNFIANNYREPQGNTGDGILKCLLKKTPLVQPCFCNNLLAFADALFLQGFNAYFLRHTSFMRPLSVTFKRSSDISGAWDLCKDRLRSHGIYNFETRVPARSIEEASAAFNKRFAEGLSNLLSNMSSNGDPSIDLLIVDEAQCLRNPYNQSNTVFKTTFEGNVSKWLFLSATPLHSGRKCLKSQINYVDDNFINEDSLKEGNERKFQDTLSKFMVRRPREFIDINGNPIGKREYRVHKEVEVSAENPLHALTMALVQKKLVRILKNKNNRFKIGFLSSFESFQESLSKHVTEDGSGQEETSDFYFNKGEIPADDERTPPDAGFITVLGKKYLKAFNSPLPHPKIDFTVESLSRKAFYENEKYVVFCRRIKAVEELCDRFELAHDEYIKDRVRTIWDPTFDWSQTVAISEDEPEIDDFDPEAAEVLAATSRDEGFREAMRKGRWIYNYRLTFRSAGRNCMYFQENWLSHFCAIAGKTIEDIEREIPDHVRCCAIEAATKPSGGKRRFFPNEYFRNIVVMLVCDYPALLGIDSSCADTWKRFFTSMYEYPSDVKIKNNKTYRAQEGILSNHGFWDEWKLRFTNDSLLCLPEVQCESVDALFKREILKACIALSFRLSDVILDLYYSEKKAKSNGTSLSKEFFDFLQAESIFSKSLRSKSSGWIRQFDLILRNCFRNERNRFDLEEMARKGYFGELANQQAVVGITGQTKINETALRQFKTPFYPQILVCTDVMKEGEDLHLFCDKVVHYGVAWTSGDLEQRVGRVDRYFSQIERRLYENADRSDTNLLIQYPFIGGTLEQWQISRVRQRVKDTERILDNLDSNDVDEKKDMIYNDSTVERDFCVSSTKKGGISISEPDFHNIVGADIVRIKKETSISEIRKYKTFASRISRIVERNGGVVGRKDNIAEFKPFDIEITTHKDERLKFTIDWIFIHDIALYGLKFLQEVNPDTVWAESFSYPFEKDQVHDKIRYYKTNKLVFPNNLNTDAMIGTLNNALMFLKQPKIFPETDPKRLKTWEKIFLKNSTLQEYEWEKDHKVNLKFNIRDRNQTASLYLYRYMILIVSKIADMDMIDPSHLDVIGDTRECFKEWCLERNRSHSLGFLHMNQKKELVYCERLMNLNIENILNEILISVALRADMYEALLTGQDVE